MSKQTLQTTSTVDIEESAEKLEWLVAHPLRPHGDWAEHLRTLLDAYRALDRKFTEYVSEVMRAPEVCGCSTETPGVFECKMGCECVCHGLYAQTDELEQENAALQSTISVVQEENARLKEALDVERGWVRALTFDLGVLRKQVEERCCADHTPERIAELEAELARSQELLASARAQSESLLQARLEAQSAQDGAEYELGEERRALNASRTLFRRLAKRYLEMRKGLRRALKEWQSHSRYGWEGFDTQARRANEAERRAYELQKHVDEWAERYSWAEVQTEYARNVAMGTAFELGRALKLLRRLDSCSPKSGCDVAAFIHSFDAPTLTKEQLDALKAEGAELRKEIAKRAREMTSGPFPTGGGAK